MIKRFLIAGAAAGLLAGAATASAQTKVRVTLDWVPQSTHGPSFIAQYEGYFKAEGLDVKIDAGKGSADAVRKLVAGTHDIGWADINAIIEYNSKNPDKAIKTVMMLYEQPPFSVCVLSKSPVKHPKELAGKTLGAPVFDASYKLFPAFAKAIGIDHKAVKRKNMDPRLREPMLLRGQVDAISGHIFSTVLAVKAAGYKEAGHPLLPLWQLRDGVLRQRPRGFAQVPEGESGRGARLHPRDLQGGARHGAEAEARHRVGQEVPAAGQG